MAPAQTLAQFMKKRWSRLRPSSIGSGWPAVALAIPKSMSFGSGSVTERVMTSAISTPSGVNATLMPSGSSHWPIQPLGAYSAVSAMPATAVGSAKGRSTSASITSSCARDGAKHSSVRMSLSSW